MCNDLVTIIIPVFNRREVIEETLFSISKQTYGNFECILVDDGSNDSSVYVISEFCKNDERFKLFIRDEDRLKGSNSCRNIGFEQSKGDYIVWFDSDDLMTVEHLAIKLHHLKKSNIDFVVARTQNFNKEGFLDPYVYEKKPYGITAEDFILRRINWYTYDVMLKREIANKIIWNEHLQSWQDYNYFIKMLLVTTHGCYINKILTHRRLHPNSIQQRMTYSTFSFSKALIDVYWYTYQDIREKIGNPIKKELVRNLMNLSFSLIKKKIFPNGYSKVCKLVFDQFGLRSFLIYQIALVVGFITGKGEFILEVAKRKN